MICFCILFCHQGQADRPADSPSDPSCQWVSCWEASSLGHPWLAMSMAENGLVSPSSSSLSSLGQIPSSPTDSWVSNWISKSLTISPWIMGASLLFPTCSPAQGSKKTLSTFAFSLPWLTVFLLSPPFFANVSILMGKEGYLHTSLHANKQFFTWNLKILI